MIMELVRLNSVSAIRMEVFLGILKREMFYGFEKQFKKLTELEYAIRKESKLN